MSTDGRRRLLRGAITALGASLLAACDRLSTTPAFVRVLQGAEKLSQATQRVVAPRKAMAQEFTEADIAPSFRGNGTLEPDDDAYADHVASGFKDWRLEVRGLVSAPASYSMAELRSMPSRTQITRHDCVEGWSTIGKWKGVPLAHILRLAAPRAEAKYVVFRCADSMEPGAEDSTYYESIDFDDAYHAQTIVAYELNGKPLPVQNGAPLRMRIERQLGYKHAKYVKAIELVASLKPIRGGNGGYWEDQGYEWYGGI